MAHRVLHLSKVKRVALLQEVVLLQKIYKVPIEEAEKFLKKIIGDLDCSLTGLSIVENGWLRVQASGRDEGVAVRLLKRECSLAPISVANVERFSTFRGRVIFSGKSRTEAFVDVGAFSPKPVYAKIPLRTLQGQLVDGRKLALQRIEEMFVLLDNLPLEVRVVRVEVEVLEAELTERQMEIFGRWVGERFDRLIVLGVSIGGVMRAVERARLEGDVLDVESLGLLEHVVVCKLGTDAVGLVPRLGRNLGGAVLGVFSPRTVLKVWG
jgi:hypothetical protein